MVCPYMAPAWNLPPNFPGEPPCPTKGSNVTNVAFSPGMSRHIFRRT